jgi:two-component system heavy metal sensor histidine kinase CusS
VLRSLSLTSRLTIFFTLVAAAIVLGLGALFFAAAERHFAELDRTTLQDKQHLIEDILANANSIDDAKRRLSEALNNHHGLYVLVNDSQGETLYRSEGFEPPRAVSSAQQSNDEHALEVWKNRGHEFHALNFHSSPAYNSSSKLNILVAIDTEHHTQFMTRLQRNLVLYAVLATLISGLLGWFAAHQGLAPLRAMKTHAAVVTGQQLNERMPVDAVPVEMADLAQELNQMLDRLQDDFQRLSEFSSDLAHELRTPISNLLTQTQVALSTKRDAETYRDILASNAEEFQRLARMVSDMLFLAKTERGVDLPNKERFPAAHEARALIEFYEAVAEEKGVKLCLQGDGDILGDRLMFRRAVSNLLSNALRHTKDQGEVEIKISETAQATIVTVENTGDDIDPKALPRLFDRFYRADPSRAHPESDGAGLGLSITRAIVRAHGGTATASSSQGKTQFSLTFPH